MSDPVFSNPAKPAPAAFAEGESSPHATHEVGHETAAGTAATESSAGQNEPQSGSSSSGQQEHAAPESFTLPAGLDIVHDSATPPAEAKAAASDTAQVIREIERAVDRMRAQGSQQMEVRLPMHDGNEVVVKLRIEQGEVKATFQSGSEELRQALETGWSQQTQSASERAGKTATTVLESPALQNSAGGFQHSRDQRQHDTGSAADEFAPKLPAQTNKRAAEAPRPALVKTPAASMQIYA